MRSNDMADHHRVESSERTPDHRPPERVFACGECGRVQVDDQWVPPSGRSSEPAPPALGVCPECADRLIADRALRLLE
jgi:hypothetical protein